MVPLIVHLGIQVLRVQTDANSNKSEEYQAENAEYKLKITNTVLGHGMSRKDAILTVLPKVGRVNTHSWGLTVLVATRFTEKFTRYDVCYVSVPKRVSTVYNFLQA